MVTGNVSVRWYYRRESRVLICRCNNTDFDTVVNVVVCRPEHATVIVIIVVVVVVLSTSSSWWCGLSTPDGAQVHTKAQSPRCCFWTYVELAYLIGGHTLRQSCHPLRQNFTVTARSNTWEVLGRWRHIWRSTLTMMMSAHYVTLAFNLVVFIQLEASH